MNWNLEGLYVEASYLDEFVVSGRVELSRVAYGGRVKHTIVLSKPATIYNKERDRLIVEHEAITRIASRSFA